MESSPGAADTPCGIQRKGFPGGSVVRNPPANARDGSSIPGLGRSPGVGYGNPLQDSCLENPMDRGAWRAIARGVTKDTTCQLNNNNNKYNMSQILYGTHL